jgi:hypothetical protein
MHRLLRRESELTESEYKTLQALSTPILIQDYLDALPFNWEKGGPTYQSPRRVLASGRAHCIEGALLAAAALWIQGEEPLLMNLSPKMNKGDFDHVVTLYRRAGRFGAISKTNHAVLRFRDPIYRTPRELALSYFHEWFLPKTGEKVLECYSNPVSLTRFGTEWLTAREDLHRIVEALSTARHYYFVPKGNWRYVRRADALEQKAGALVEWPRHHPRT